LSFSSLTSGTANDLNGVVVLGVGTSYQY
jgi:hypothetical protein